MIKMAFVELVGLYKPVVQCPERSVEPVVQHSNSGGLRGGVCVAQSPVRDAVIMSRHWVETAEGARTMRGRDQ